MKLHLISIFLIRNISHDKMEKISKPFVTVTADKEQEFLAKLAAGQIDSKKVIFVNGSKSTYIVTNGQTYADLSNVYSAEQVDTLISKIKVVLTALGATTEQIDSITL